MSSLVVVDSCVHSSIFSGLATWTLHSAMRMMTKSSVLSEIISEQQKSIVDHAQVICSRNIFFPPVCCSLACFLIPNDQKIQVGKTHRHFLGWCSNIEHKIQNFAALTDRSSTDSVLLATFESITLQLLSKVSISRDQKHIKNMHWNLFSAFKDTKSTFDVFFARSHRQMEVNKIYVTPLRFEFREFCKVTLTRHIGKLQIAFSSAEWCGGARDIMWENQRRRSISTTSGWRDTALVSKTRL